MVSRKKPAVSKVHEQQVNAKKPKLSDDSDDTAAEENWPLDEAASTSKDKVKSVSPRKSTTKAGQGNGDAMATAAVGTPEVDEEEPKKVEWKRLNDFVDFLVQLTESNPDLKKRKGLSQLDSILTPEQREQWPDFETLTQAFRNFYQKSTSVKLVRLPTAFLAFSDFMQDETSVLSHPEYPKQALSAYMILCRKLGLKIGCASQASRIKDPTDVVGISAVQEAEKDKERFFVELRTFLDKNRDAILPSHVAYVERKLRKHDKELFKALNPESTPKKAPTNQPTKKTKRAKLTAFDYYKQSKKHKFLELPAEEREAKLKRHFEKLDEDKRRIFEDLALNL